MIFDRAFNHVNYEDPDINVPIPVFSNHGNHDDPSRVREIYMLGSPFSCPRFAPESLSNQLLRLDP